jgi:hypothetical protein
MIISYIPAILPGCRFGEQSIMIMGMHPEMVVSIALEVFNDPQNTRKVKFIGGF